MKKFQGVIFAVIVIALINSGCSGRINLKESDRLALQSVSVSEDVEMAKEIFVEGATHLNNLGLVLLFQK